MLNSMVRRISAFFIKNEIISSDEIGVYEYCIEILLSTVINFAFVMIVSVIFNRVIETLFYLVGFIPLRRVAGGYHAQTHLRCFCTLAAAYFAFLAILHFWGKQSDINPIFMFALQVINVLIVLLLAPVKNANKPVTEQEMKKFRLKGRLAVSANSIISFSLFPFAATYALCVILGTVTVSLSLISANLIEMKEKTNG